MLTLIHSQGLTFIEGRLYVSLVLATSDTKITISGHSSDSGHSSLSVLTIVIGLYLGWDQHNVCSWWVMTHGETRSLF
jgi:hypothetical protein